MFGVIANVKGHTIDVKSTDFIVAGTVGASAAFVFDDDTWRDLTKIAVFRAGGISKDVVLTNESVTIPWEVLTKPHTDFYIGVYGRNETGFIVIPTVWAKVGVIKPGADPSGSESTEPTPGLLEQMIDVVQKANDIAERIRNDAENGIFNGKDGENGKDGVNGVPGYTPQKGVDYYTPEDKIEMVQSVLAALPIYNGEVEEV